MSQTFIFDEADSREEKSFRRVISVGPDVAAARAAARTVALQIRSRSEHGQRAQTFYLRRMRNQSAVRHVQHST